MAATTKKPEKNYMTADELAEVRSLLLTLDNQINGYISIGDVPVADANGEDLGVLRYADGDWRFVPA